MAFNSIVLILLCVLLQQAVPIGATAAGNDSGKGLQHSTAWQDSIVYVLIPSKFSNGNPKNDFMKRRYGLPNSLFSGGFLGGDIAGIDKKIGYIKRLGVTTVLLYPMFANDTRPVVGSRVSYLASGYRVRDYHQIDPNFGTDADYIRMLSFLHSSSNGPRMDVIQDLPIAMTGLEHEWYVHASEYPWYFRPFDTQDRSQNIASSPLELPYGGVDNAYAMPIVNVAQGIDTSSGVYAQVRDNTVFWLMNHYDLDGFRYDSAQNLPAAFWRRLLDDFRLTYAQSHPAFVHVAEDFVLGPKKPWQVYPNEMLDNQASGTGAGTIGMTGAYDFGLIWAIQQVFAIGKDAHTIVDTMNLTAASERRPECLIASADNYDVDTFLSHVHDDNAKSRLLLALTFLITVNRVPFIYSGNEYGIDYSEPDTLFKPGLDQLFRRQFGTLVSIRRRIAAFRRGTFEWLNTSPTLLCYERAYLGEEYVIALNIGPVSQTVVVDLNAVQVQDLRLQDVLDPTDKSMKATSVGGSSNLTISLGPWGTKIIRLR